MNHEAIFGNLKWHRCRTRVRNREDVCFEVAQVGPEFSVDLARYDMGSVQRMRWPTGGRCTSCDSSNVAKRGFDETQKERQRYRCSDCQREFESRGSQKKNEKGVGGV